MVSSLALRRQASSQRWSVHAILFVAAILSDASVLVAEELTYEQHVRPIFKAHCFHCHGEEPDLSGELDLRLVRLMQQGGNSGAAIVPGNAAESLLWERILLDEMPEGSKKLTTAQKQLVKDWIDQGAETARTEPDDPHKVRFTAEELAHWAYQPVQLPAIPRINGSQIRNEIDAFVARQLSQHGLTFSPLATRATLIRRLTFDLLGVPPSPLEIEAFVSDDSPFAYERLVDRLLASPQFGVRWGRHWLDVAGFAETNGGQGADTDRPHAWRYRDYVVDSFNQSKPIDVFYIEQLAGDELLGEPLDIGNSRHQELLTATGFLRMAPDATQNENTLANRNLAAADALRVVSSVMLGTTVGCAQCHDHKYDPIAIDDYYRFRAIFDPVFPLQDWQTPNSRVMDFTPEDVHAAAATIENRAQQLEDDLNRRRNELAQQIQERKLADVPAEVRNATREAVLTTPKERSASQRELLDLYPMVKPIANIVGLLVEYDMPAYRQFEKEAEQITAIRATKPPRQIVMTTQERPTVIPVTHVLFRGNPEAPGEEIAPGVPTAFNQFRGKQIPQNDNTTLTTGRRRAYAHQLTDGTHPLAARVFVNRTWMHHFGRGIVATVSDFGLSGEPPSHPQLLDWLANDLIQHGWDQKRLHRLIVSSTVYRQVSRRTAQLDSIDPENIYLSRMNLRRLEAEAIRDAVFAVCDDLDLNLGGPSIPVTQNQEGKVVLGVATVRDGLQTGVDRGAASVSRRSIYIQAKRRLPLNMLATFDQPLMNPNCEQRRHSTVATQSLWFLNDEMIVDRSHQLSYQLVQQSSIRDEQINHLFQRLFAMPASVQELRACREFIENQHRRFLRQPSHTPPQAELHAVAALCQTLLASNRFLYVD